MAISNTEATKLNNSMRAAQDVSLGTLIQGLQLKSAGSVTINSVHTNASAVTLYTGFTSPVQGVIVQAFRGGSPIYNPYVGKSGGSVTFTANTAGSYVLTVGDVFNWMAF